MEFLVGTTSGVFSGEGREPAAGIEGRGVRRLTAIGGDLFAGAADGVYRSEDGGCSWEKSGVDGYDVWEVTAAAADPRTLYAGTQPAHLFKSTDGGDTWKENDAFLDLPGAEQWCVPNNPLGARALTLMLDPFDPLHILLGIEVGGVLASRDGGESWTLHPAGENADIHVLAAHPQRHDVVYVTTGFGRNDGRPADPRMAGLYRSENGGASWQYLGERMQPHYTRPVCIDPRAPFALTLPTAPDVRSSIKDAGGAQAMLYRSEDDGESWRSLGDAAHAPSAARLTAVTPDAERPGWVLVGTETGEVWRVSDEAAWTKLTDGLPPVQALLSL